MSQDPVEGLVFVLVVRMSVIVLRRSEVWEERGGMLGCVRLLLVAVCVCVLAVRGLVELASYFWFVSP